MASDEGDGVKPEIIEPTKAGWEFHADNRSAPDSETATPVEPSEPQNISVESQEFGDSNETKNDSVDWTALEYVGHEKNAGWFIILGIGTLLFSGFVYLVTRHDIVATGVVLLMGLAFGFFAARKPQELEYSADDYGIKIGPKQFGYDHFKSFAVMHDDPHHSILLLPLKRFAPSVSMYYPETDEKDIVSVISNHLPVEERSHDLTEQLMRKIRF